MIYCMLIAPIVQSFFLILFSGLVWAAKVSVSFVFNFLKAVRIYVLAQTARRRNLAVVYGGRWAG